ncbi:2'-5' RNA ligase family protein [Rudanella paleaurantiibacter]|uniref:2'-5' RNA ligase family protein n=1 Tax=Rudanella paleaurantiibacter TaxID=2614655 RepID=A0A7J5TVJ5_9BACT|nr:2'-5' RNA ligase family protein [Rudanella paleaurantiibacter]KAB7728175.1 2'-5' RNA ligase family protein [Rudanella paleaurantiibacter]
MAINIRRQLTLFVDPKDAETIEQVRQAFNPRQFELIKSHVTLCREDEIENLEQVISNLHSLTLEEIVIEFGKPTRFDNGQGLFLPATRENASFQELRKQILIGLNDNPRKQEAHITLMHPRNSTCTDAIFHQIEKLSLPNQLRFGRISLIEQADGGQWKILQEFELRKSTLKPI